jgi:hypothetical protein
MLRAGQVQSTGFLDILLFEREYDRNPSTNAHERSSLDMFSLRDRARPTKQPQVGSSKILDQVDSLIDNLLNDSDMASSSLASMLMAARESVRDGSHVALARRIWDASNDLKLRECPDEPDPVAPGRTN